MFVYIEDKLNKLNKLNNIRENIGSSRERVRNHLSNFLVPHDASYAKTGFPNSRKVGNEPTGSRVREVSLL